MIVGIPALHNDSERYSGIIQIFFCKIRFQEAIFFPTMVYLPIIGRPGLTKSLGSQLEIDNKRQALLSSLGTEYCKP